MKILQDRLDEILNNMSFPEPITKSDVQDFINGILDKHKGRMNKDYELSHVLSKLRDKEFMTRVFHFKNTGEVLKPIII